VLEERLRDHGADRVAPPVLSTGATAPVAVEAREGVAATSLGCPGRAPPSISSSANRSW
jgi:hypothetical protein